MSLDNQPNAIGFFEIYLPSRIMVLLIMILRTDQGEEFHAI